VSQGGGAADAICVDGTSYELTLLVPGRSHSVRRACDSAEIGQAANVLEVVFALALGHEPRFDVLYPRGGDFSAARRAYEGLVAEGGTLRATPNSRPQAPEVTPPPEPEPQPPAPAPAPPAGRSP
jgi:hypothetical protein